MTAFQLLVTSLTVVLFDEMNGLTRKARIWAWAAAVVCAVLPGALLLCGVRLGSVCVGVECILLSLPCLLPFFRDKDEERFINFNSFFLGRGAVLFFTFLLALFFFGGDLSNRFSLFFVLLIPAAFIYMLATRQERPNTIDMVLALLAEAAVLVLTICSLEVVVRLFVEEETRVSPTPYAIYMPIVCLVARIMAEPHLERVPNYVRLAVRIVPLFLLPACLCTLIIMITETLSMGLTVDQVIFYMLQIWGIVCLFVLLKREGMLRRLLLSFVIVCALAFGGLGYLFTSRTNNDVHMEELNNDLETLSEMDATKTKAPSDNMERINNPIFADDVASEVEFTDEEYKTSFEANANGDYHVTLPGDIALVFTADQADELKCGMAGDVMNVQCNGRADGFLLTAFACDHDIDNDTYYIYHLAGHVVK